IWYWYPLYCLGGISFIGFIVLTITGNLFGFYYIPDGRLELGASGDLTNPAWRSMLTIMNDIPFGFIIRGMHHWAAHIMIAAVVLDPRLHVAPRGDGAHGPPHGARLPSARCRAPLR